MKFQNALKLALKPLCTVGDGDAVRERKPGSKYTHFVSISSRVLFLIYSLGNYEISHQETDAQTSQYK